MNLAVKCFSDTRVFSLVFKSLSSASPGVIRIASDLNKAFNLQDISKGTASKWLNI